LVEIRFLVRKGSYGTKSVSELRENLEMSIGGNDMGCVSAEEISIKVNGRITAFGSVKVSPYR